MAFAGRLGLVSNAAGSAAVEFNGTSAIAVVRGPYQSAEARDEHGRVMVTVSSDPVSVVRRNDSDVNSAINYELSVLVQSVLSLVVLSEQFPRLVYDIQVQLLVSDGNDLAASVMAASLALVDANVELKDVPGVCTLVWVAPGQFVVNPSPKQALEAIARLTVVATASGGEILHTAADGAVDAEVMVQGVTEAARQCAAQHAGYRAVLTEKA